MTLDPRDKLVLPALKRKSRTKGPTIASLKSMAEKNKQAIAKFTNHKYSVKKPE